MTDKILLLQLMADIDGLSVFSSIKKNILLQTFRSVLKTLCAKYDSVLEPLTSDSLSSLVNDWSAFTQAFVSDSNAKTFYAKICNMLISDDNLFTRNAEKFSLQEIDPVLIALTKTDLTRLGRIAAANISDIAFSISNKLKSFKLIEAAYLIEEECRFLCSVKDDGENNFLHDSPWENSLEKFAEHIRKTGAGEFGQHKTF
jgi:hypothetical protein